jgi:hypothetical protein
MSTLGELEYITVTPSPATCTDHGQVQLTVIGHYDSGMDIDLTQQVAYYIQTPGLYEGIATVSNGHGKAGLVTGIKPGTVTCTVQYPPFVIASGY